MTTACRSQIAKWTPYDHRWFADGSVAPHGTCDVFDNAFKFLVKLLIELDVSERASIVKKPQSQVSLLGG